MAARADAPFGLIARAGRSRAVEHVLQETAKTALEDERTVWSAATRSLAVPLTNSSVLLLVAHASDSPETGVISTRRAIGLRLARAPEEVKPEGKSQKPTPRLALPASAAANCSTILPSARRAAMPMPLSIAWADERPCPTMARPDAEERRAAALGVIDALAESLERIATPRDRRAGRVLRPASARSSSTSPSPTLSAMFPVKPSQTITSTLPVNSCGLRDCRRT